MHESVAPGEAGLAHALVGLVVECWRFSRTFARVLDKLDDSERVRFANQQRFFARKLDESLAACGCWIVNLEGQPYDPGVAATALNIGDFGPDDRLAVSQMIEPVVMGQGGLVRAGTVMLERIDS